MAELEFPRWVYPPDGGKGKVADTPDDVPSGWVYAPTEPGYASGERVIGQPEPPPEPTPDDDSAKKSKKK